MTKEQITERLKQNEIDRQRLEEEKIKLEKQLKEDDFAYVGKFGEEIRLILKVTPKFKSMIENTPKNAYAAIDKEGLIQSGVGCIHNSPSCNNVYTDIKPIFGEKE